MLKSKPNTNEGHTYIQWFTALTANIAALNQGLQAGWISPMIKYLQSDNSPVGAPLTDNEISWLASILCISAVFGVPLFSIIIDKFGRKIGLITIALFQAICWMIKLGTASTMSLIIARVFCGVAAGGCFNVIPLYVKEISQDDIRGKLGTLLIVLQNTGILFMYALGAYVEYSTVLWVVVGLPIVNILMLLKVPESPAFLIKMDKIDKATEAIAFLRSLSINDKLVENEVNAFKNEHLYYNSLPNISFWSIFTVKSWRRTFLLLLILMIIQATNGAYALVTYAALVLSLCGVSFSPELQTLSFPALMIVGALVSMNCVEKFGRKPVIVITTFLTFLMLSCLSTILILQEYGYSNPSWMPVICMIIVVTSYSGGVALVPYILISEMFNFQIRAKAIGCIVTIGWLATFIQVAAFGPLSSSFGLHSAFFVFAAVNLFGFIISITCLPETKDKTVEEIEASMSGNAKQQNNTVSCIKQNT